jgi:protease-4
MNLEQIYMFNGCLYYDPNAMFLLEPLRAFMRTDRFEQLISTFGNASSEEDSKPLMSINKKTRIATIPIQGALVPRTDPFMKMIGADVTSTSEINQSVQRALDDKDIKGVLFKANSGGGSAGGIDETAQMINELSNKKPVFTHVSGSNGSACYYLTSQSNRIFANTRTDQIGSIGTKLIIHDTSKAAEQAGIKPVVIATGKNKNIGGFGVPITEDQIELVSEMVDSLQEFFEESITRKRPQMNLSEVNDGRTFFARQAQKRSLIDGIRSERDVRAMLEASIR